MHGNSKELLQILYQLHKKGEFSKDGPSQPPQASTSENFTTTLPDISIHHIR